MSSFERVNKRALAYKTSFYFYIFYPQEVKLYHQLMADGSRPVDAIKVFLCGDPGVGKSTIKNTLTKVS